MPTAAEFFARHPVFTREEFVEARAAADSRRSPRTADRLLSRYVSQGRLIGVRRGLYASVPLGTSPDEYPVDPYLVATKLAPEATVAYHSALQFWGKVYSVWNRVAVVAPRHFRPFEFRGTEFQRVSPPSGVSESMSARTVEESYGGGVARVTTVERAFVDVLDRPTLGGGWEEIWRSLEMVELFDLEAVFDYALELGSDLTVARVGLFLDQHKEGLFLAAADLECLVEHVPRQPRYLDSTRMPGRLVHPWNLVVPEYVLERRWQEVA